MSHADDQVVVGHPLNVVVRVGSATFAGAALQSAGAAVKGLGAWALDRIGREPGDKSNQPSGYKGLQGLTPLSI